MVRPERDDLTQLIRRALEAPRAAAAEEAVGYVWQEIRRRAAARLASERRGHTLAPTDLAAECFLALLQMNSLEVPDRARFFALIHRLLENILAEHARRKRASKRGRGHRRVPLSEELIGEPSCSNAHLDLESALEWLGSNLPDEREALERKYYRGETFKQIADAMRISESSARNRVRCALVSLLRVLES
jgi:RNA polymerase sigma factor (TIGR02999 family)